MASGGRTAGELSSGSSFVVDMPDRWNGTLLLFSHPVPVADKQPPWDPGEPPVGPLVEAGYAVAGSANTIFWPLELAFTDQPALLDIATEIVGRPRLRIACGLSIGGIMTAGLVQLFGERLSGALPMCGNLAGAVANHNRELDMAFVVKTLLAPETPLRVTGIPRGGQNLEIAMGVLHEAQADPKGRARLALAAAVGDTPGWHDPTVPEPAPEDFEGQQRQQFALFESVGFLVYFLARHQVELQAGGNPSWNTDSDYADLLARSAGAAQVAALYESAGLDLTTDLDRLAGAKRIEADPDAVEYLERHIVFDGRLHETPVLTMHTTGDALVTPNNAREYAQAVGAAGKADLLRQLYVYRGGHCTFTAAEILTALELLVERIESGRWPSLDVAALNQAATSKGDGYQTMHFGHRAEPAFVDYEPRPYLRPYDAVSSSRR